MRGIKKNPDLFQIIPAGIGKRAGRILFFSLLVIWSSCARKVIPPVPTLPPKVPTIRVCLTDQLSTGRLSFTNTYQLRLEEASYLLDSTVGEFQVSWEQQELIFRSDSRFFSFEEFTRIEFVPLSGGEFSWQGIPYKGKITFVKDLSAIIVVNELLLPDYLAGVVPCEIPSHSEEYYQAIISQSIAAATYACYSVKNPVSPFFDLFADTRDQIYQGILKRTPLADKAVAESNGLCLQNSSGQLVKVQYHSTCGGIIDRPPVDPEFRPESAIPSEPLEQPVYCQISPMYRWVRKFTAQALLDNLLSMELVTPAQVSTWKNQGFMLQLEILSRKSSGRVEKLKVKIAEQEILLTEWQIRCLLADPDGNPQPSNLFIIKASPSNPEQFYVIGAGYGHGRGMCQWGAIGQALSGKSYQEILNFYYPELQLRKIF